MFGQHHIEGVLEGNKGVKVESRQKKRRRKDSPRRLEVSSATTPPSQSLQDCVARPAPPRSRALSREYNSICKTHKRLVRSGALTCSVSLSDTPPTVTVDLPPAPDSPTPEQPFLEGSTHFGIIGDFSGFQTPLPSPASTPTVPQPLIRGVSVIQSAPPTLLPRQTPTSYPAPPVPLRPDHSTPLRTIVDRQELGAIPRRLSSTDPQLLDHSETILNVGRISLTEVFREDQVSPESSQGDTSVIMDRRQCQEQAYILKQKGRRVARQMTEFVEDDLSTSRITVMEADLARIRDLKDEYQDSIEGFLDMFAELIGSEAVER